MPFLINLGFFPYVFILFFKEVPQIQMLIENTVS